MNFYTVTCHFVSRLDAMTDNAKTEWHILKSQPWNSAPDVSFWQNLSSLKLDKFQLNDQAQHLTGYFTPGRSTDVPARFTVDDSAFAPSWIVDARGSRQWPRLRTWNRSGRSCTHPRASVSNEDRKLIVPHQVRGFLNAFEKGVVAGPVFDKCNACSPKVLRAYVADGFDLLACACHCTTYLDELTGLSELVDDADARMADVEDSDEDGTLV
ncbi:hypothetical protein PsorP6_003116 [Peronosclerospora sorghi]|uniref:Uncharacterized protein n=1 Tax=Peronosclerospora sorghi TaxID=230839 RepID=A0ACC0VPF0_9STRA|nr:hypothetical protein PsorP6_003116 [Peronosclerospora sorghi]